MSATNKRTLEQANAAIAAGDHERFLTYCADDTQWTFVGDTTIRGKAALREWMAEAYREPPRFDVHRMIAEGDFVTALGEITLKDEDGTPTRYAYCDVWRFSGGRMAELQAFVIEAPTDGRVEPDA